MFVFQNLLKMCYISFARNHLKTMKRALFMLSLSIILTLCIFQFGLVKTNLEYCLRRHKISKSRQDAAPPRSIVLWTRWRSGSSFVGELMASTSLETFYSFEPLHTFNDDVMLFPNTTSTNTNTNGTTMTGTISSNNYTRFATRYLSDLLQCRLSSHQSIVERFGYASKNPALSELCSAGCCHHAVLVEEQCRAAEILIAKLMRLPLSSAWPVLESNADTRIVFFTRDPRPVMLSRSAVDWCASRVCTDPRVVCDVMRDDLRYAALLLRDYPLRFYFLHYEDVSSSPEKVLTQLWKFLELPLDGRFYSSVAHHTNGRAMSPGGYGTSANSRAHLERWRQDIEWSPRDPCVAEWSMVEVVQESCGDVLEALGLRFFRSQQELRNTSVSSLLPPPL